MSTLTMAYRNVKKSFSDYGVYFLTIVIGVTMFYIFNSIESQSAMMEVSENQYALLFGLDTAMSFLSYFISAILAFLILYANAFLVRRRKKELGIYMTLGMRKQQISRILIAETTIVGVFSLVVGIVVGIFASQGIALLTAHLYQFAVKSEFVFVFSMNAFVKSIVYFGIAFVIVMIFNTININRQKLIDLIYADKRQLIMKSSSTSLSVVLWIGSIVLLGFAYFQALHVGFVGIFTSKGLLPILCGVMGTFLFFYSLSGFALKLISKIQGIYFKGLNLFTLGQVGSKITSTHISMSFITLLLFIAISAITIGYSMTESIKVGFSADATTANAVIIYITYYIGIVFILACASILAIGQLSDASDNRIRYVLLSKLGANEHMLTVSVFQQVLLQFAAPLVVAIIHSIVAIAIMSRLLDMVGHINIIATSMLSGFVVLALYGGYFLMTFLNAKRIALRCS